MCDHFHPADDGGAALPACHFPHLTNSFGGNNLAELLNIRDAGLVHVPYSCLCIDGHLQL